MQALVQQQISPHPGSMPMVMPYQHIQAQELQPGYERHAKRRQSSSPGGSNRGDRFDCVACDAKPGGEIAIQSSTVTDGLSQILNQPLSQGHISWTAQAPNFAGLPQVHQPLILQHFKQQLSSLQIPSLQHKYGFLRIFCRFSPEISFSLLKIQLFFPECEFLSSDAKCRLKQLLDLCTIGGTFVLAAEITAESSILAFAAARMQSILEL